jgi:excinuclease UvrABC nuclease subunit
VAVIESASIFEHSATFDPSGDFEAFLKTVPARWAVYLMSDGDGRPVQLLCVKNLRASLKRRLGGEDAEAAPSKRVDYRELVRRIDWRRVDSRFEADIVYLEAARAIFPQTYQGMIGFRYAWFVHVNPEANFPRYVKTIDLATKTGLLIGPIEDKHAAAKLIQITEDAFDLCRYYNILIEAPNGKACAYKEMGKCPAPCDGSISMPQYHRMIEWSAQVIVDPGDYIREQTRRMNQAAAELKFETAGKIKAYVDLLSQLGKGPLRHARRLEDFAYVSLQRGPWEGTAKLFVVTPGAVEEVCGLTNEPARDGELLREVLEVVSRRRTRFVDSVSAERIAVVAAHLFKAKNSDGVILRVDDLDEKSLAKAYRDLMKQQGVEEEEGEGIMKELQEMGTGEAGAIAPSDQE